MRREIPGILQNALLDANSGVKKWSYAYCACCGTNNSESQHGVIRDTSSNDGSGNYITGSKVYVDGNTPEELVSKGMPLDAIKEGWRPFFIMKDKDGHSFPVKQGPLTILWSWASQEDEARKFKRVPGEPPKHRVFKTEKEESDWWAGKPAADNGGLLGGCDCGACNEMRAMERKNKKAEIEEAMKGKPKKVEKDYIASKQEVAA